MKFNINNYVKVRLTDRGREILLEQHNDLNCFRTTEHLSPLDYNPPKEDGEGYSRWQMWSLINTFGEYTCIGKEPPFETDIILEE